MSAFNKPYHKREFGNKNPNEELKNMINSFWINNKNKEDTKNHELEVRFATKSKDLGIKPLTKIDYTKVIHKLKSLGFTIQNPEGEYMLRIQNEFLDQKTGKYKLSYAIRSEINGFDAIKDYCSHNDISKLLKNPSFSKNVNFYIKEQYKKNEERMFPVDFPDFNFRVSYQTEDKINKKGGMASNIIDNWDKSLKNYRYINRVTLTHPDFPIKVDMSIVKSSLFDFKSKKHRWCALVGI